MSSLGGVRRGVAGTAARDRSRDRPLIALSQSFHDFGDYAGVGVQRPVFAAGGLPVTLAQLPGSVSAALDAVDGLVLAPGRDIAPARYGQEPGPLLAATEPQRDEFELALVPEALARGIPILGICRGIQILNVALGGTLVQDVSLLAPGHPTDRGWVRWGETEQASLAGQPPPEHPRHPTTIAESSLLAAALGTMAVEVNSYHHQAIERLGDGLDAVAVAPDGVIEAVELTGRPVLAVQWELQEEARGDARFQAVFEWFVGAVRAALPC
jgi:gamma-glutamyl-gamma-aminobutyrate hydrolase PuuD